MFDQLEEARALDEMLLILTNFRKLAMPDDQITAIPKMFRFTQNSLRDQKKRFTFYPQQMITLARYYYYTKYEALTAADKPDAAAYTKKQLETWMDCFARCITEETGLCCKDSTQMRSPVYQLPFFDSAVPLDGIVTEAILAGKLAPFRAYPDPQGLVMYTASPKPGTDGVTVGDQYSESPARFWRAQLWALCEREYLLTKEGQKAAAKGTVRPEKIAACRIKPRVRAMLSLMLWYAGRVSEIRDTGTALGISAPAHCVLKVQAEVKYIHDRVFKPFANQAALTQCMLDHKALVTYGPIGGKLSQSGTNMIGFLFADPETLTLPEEADFPLPEPEDLDDGVRLCDDEAAFYHVTAGHLKELLLGMTQHTAAIEGGRFSIRPKEDGGGQPSAADGGEQLTAENDIADTLKRYYVQHRGDCSALLGRAGLRVTDAAAMPELLRRYLARARTYAALLLQNGAAKPDGSGRIRGVFPHPLRMQTFGGDSSLMEQLMQAEQRFMQELERTGEKSAEKLK